MFELEPGVVSNPKRALEMMDRLRSGGFKFLRATNAGGFQDLPKTHAHITWAEFLGQHCSSYFEPPVPEEPPSAAEEKGQRGGGTRGGGIPSNLHTEGGEIRESEKCPKMSRHVQDQYVC